MRHISAFILAFLIILGIGIIFGDFVEKEAATDLEPLIVDLEETFPEKAVDENMPTGEKERESRDTAEAPAPTASIASESPSPAPAPEQPAMPPISLTEVNLQVRAALVNILCTTQGGGPLKPITGSGIIIDKRGVILTNAHLAQYFLLKNYQTENFVDCVIRTGNPATPMFRTDLLYIPTIWIEKNVESITKANPAGTGENDFAFLLIQEHIQEDKNLPASFPSVETDTSESYLRREPSILVASYPAEFLSGQIVQRDFYAVSTISSIGQLYTFASTTIDVISTGGNLVAQLGSSGGAVMGNHNKLIGIIALSTEGETTSERDLRAVTLAHIERSLTAQTGGGITELLSGNLSEKAEQFNHTTAPILTELLIAELEK